MPQNRAKAIFVAKKMFTQLVYDFQSLEGMPFTFPEVQTFIQGITVGGHKIEDQEKLKQQQLAWKYLIDLVEQGKFEVSAETACKLEGIVAKDEALVPGHIRDGVVSVSSGDFTYHPPHHSKLPGIMEETIRKASDAKVNVYARGYNLCVDFVYNQFHWDGNKRTGTLLMNGLFLTNGILPCSVPAKKLKEYNFVLMDLYKTGNRGGVEEFYKECHKEIHNDWGVTFFWGRKNDIIEN